MKKLDKIIYNTLFEQRGKIKKVPVDAPIPLEVPDRIPDVRRNILKPANRAGLQIGQQHGAVLDGWSVFTVMLIASRAGKENVAKLDTSLSATSAIHDLADEKGVTHYGQGGYFDKKESDGTAKYMYIVGADVSKFKRVFKHNVWICNFHQLYTLSKKLNEIEPLTYYENIESIYTDFTFGNIPVFTFEQASKWFKALQYRLQSLSPEQKQSLRSLLKPKNSAVLIPELQYLNQDYNPTENPLQSKTVTITDTNKYGYGGNFRGDAKLDYDANGNQILIPLKGTISVFRKPEYTPGIFTGDFKNGAPDSGKVEYEDGLIEYVKPGDAEVYIKPDGTRSFTFFSRGTKIETPVRYTWRDSEDIIRLIQTDIKAMLDNNPEWVQSFSGIKQYPLIQAFDVTGIWDEPMRTVSWILNVQFLGDDAMLPDGKTVNNDALITIPKTTRDAIIKYQTEKIPL